MNVTPIDRILESSQQEPTVLHLLDYIDAMVQKNSQDIVELRRQVEHRPDSIRPAAYHLNNVVKPVRAPQADDSRVKTIEKIVYFLLGMMLTFMVMSGLRQIERRQKR